MAAIVAPGWYGKLPSTGDFLHHRLSEKHIAPWTHWFQQGLMHWHSQEQAATSWFLQAPVWNFVLPITPGVQQVQRDGVRPVGERAAPLPGERPGGGDPDRPQQLPAGAHRDA